MKNPNWSLLWVKKSILYLSESTLFYETRSLYKILILVIILKNGSG